MMLAKTLLSPRSEFVRDDPFCDSKIQNPTPKCARDGEDWIARHNEER